MAYGSTVTQHGERLFTRDDVYEGQLVYEKYGLMEYGTIFGHGAYLGPDFTADYIERARESMVRYYAAHAVTDASTHLVDDFKTNRWDGARDARTEHLSCARVAAKRRQPWNRSLKAVQYPYGFGPPPYTPYRGCPTLVSLVRRHKTRPFEPKEWFQAMTTTKRATWDALGAALISLVGCGVGRPAPVVPPADSGGANGQVDATAHADVDSATDGGDIDGSNLSPEAAALVAARPYTIHVPPGYDPARPAPLLVMLHGYSADGQLEEDTLFHLTPASDTYGFLYALPDGTVDSMGSRFWNATDACCNFYGSRVDDVAYLNAVMDDIESSYRVDLKQVFVGGHSNGAIMAQVLACRTAERIAAVYSYAGALWENTSLCAPDGPVSVVELHGDMDPTVPYDGGSNTAFPQSPPYPSAPLTVATWASRDGCNGTLVDDGEAFDLVPSLPGSETTVAKAGGCSPGIDAELWTVHGGGHMDALSSPAFGDVVWGFLHGHPKP